MYRIFLSILAASLLFLTSCASLKNTEKLVVASAQADCVGVAPMKCLLVKTAGQQNWHFFYSGIEGFTYQPGYEYTLVVRKENIPNPAADQSSIRYIFVKEVSKVRKESENLPPLKRE